MTRLQSFAAIVAAATALAVVISVPSPPRIEEAETEQAFWTLQGASPRIAPEAAAIVALRTAERHAAAADMLAAAD